MRFNDILTEDHLRKDDFKERYRLVNFIKKLSTPGDPFLDIDGNPIEVQATPKELEILKGFLKNNFNPDDPNPKTKSSPSFDVPTTIGGVKLSKLTKTTEFGAKTGKSASGPDDFTQANLGPAVETLKSFAIFAKLVFRNREVIDATDILKVAKKATESSREIFATSPSTGKKSKSPTTLATYTMNVSDANKTIKDSITLKVALSTGSFKRAANVNESDEALWGHLQGILSYVNTESDIGKYSRYFKKNNRKDPLHIAVVGIGGAKTDIKTVYQNDKKNKVDDNGEATGRVLPNLSMSLKSADAKWYDQTSANYVTGIKKAYNIVGLTDAEAEEDVIATKFIEGGKNTTTAEYQARRDAQIKIFNSMYARLKARIPQLNDAGEADYLYNFLENMKHSFTGNEKLVYVNFNAKGTYYKIKPQLIGKLSKIVNIDVIYNVSAKAGLPRIHWIDTISGKYIANVLLSDTKTEKRLTYQFNLGDGFTELMKQAEALENAQVVKQAPQPVAPVAQANPAPMPQTPNVTNLQGSDFTSQTASKVGQDDQEKEVAETGTTWIHPQPHKVDELTRLLKLARNH